MQSGLSTSSLAGRANDVGEVVGTTPLGTVAIVLVAAVVIAGLTWLGVWLYGRHNDRQRQRQEFTRAAAQAQEQLDTLFQAARGVIGQPSRALLRRLDHNLARLGEQDRGAIAIPAERHMLEEANRQYDALMAGRNVVDNAVSLTGDDTPEGGHTIESLTLLAEQAAQLLQQVQSVGTAGAAITAVCEGIEDAVARTPQRSDTLAQRRLALAKRVDSLRSQGFNMANLRRRVGSATGQLTQAGTAATHDNFMTARRHLDAAERLVKELEEECEGLEESKRRIDDQIATFAQMQQEALDGLKRVQNQLATLAADYSPVALKGLSESFTQGQQGMERTRGRLADLRRYVAKGELEAAATLAETISSVFNAIRDLVAQANELPRKLEDAAREFPRRRAEVLGEIQALTGRINARPGKQRSYSQRAAELLIDVRTAGERARRNPLGAMEELEAIRAKIAEIEQRSQAASEKRTTR